MTKESVFLPAELATLCLLPAVISVPGRTQSCPLNGGLPSEQRSDIKDSFNTEQLTGTLTHIHAQKLLIQWGV